MSSSELQNIIETIEGQDTDHFGKFYLYVSLLHKATVRDQRTFASLLPKHNGGFFHKSRSVDVGSNLIELPGSIDAYSQQFHGKTYDPVNSAVTLVSTYFRTGKIMDLISIVKQMYSHLSLIERELTANNRKIFDKLDFSHKQHQLLPLLQQLNQISDQYISMTDSAINGTVASVAALTGLIVVIASGFYFTPLIIGLGLLAGGVMGAINYFEKASEKYQQLAEATEHLQGSVRDLPQDESFFGNDSNFKNFILAILKPIAYTAPTVMESVIMNDDMASDAAETRSSLDLLFRFA